VSIPPYISVLKALGGDTITVRSAIPPGFDPHTSEITPKQAQLIESCQLFIGIGEMYEKRLLASLESSKKKARVLKLSDTVDLLSYDEDGIFVDACHDTKVDDPSSKDNHFWLSPRRMISQAYAIKDVLTKMQPQHNAFYEERLHAYIEKLKSLNDFIRQTLRPYREQAVVVSHPFLGYFCHDYELVQIAVECEGKSPHLHGISRVLELAKNSRTHCVITSPQFHNKGAELIAEELKLPVFDIDPLEEDLFKTLNQIVNALVKANS